MDTKAIVESKFVKK